MAGTIKMTPEELRTAAKGLLDQKEEIFNILRVMDGSIKGLDWSGTAQQKFTDLWNETNGQVQNMLTETVTGISDALKGVAQALEDVDNQVL